MRIIFLGTPDFSVPSLQALIDSHHEVLAVVTQPDKPVGRSGKLCFSPVKQLALKNNIPVLQYQKIRFEGVSDLKELAPDIMVTCAFGQILSKEIIDIAPHGIINVHASLLPRYRGAAPIQWSVINGDKQTGITIMQTEEGIDTGDIIKVKKTDIGNEETSEELFERLAVLGSTALIEALDDIESGKAVFVKQNNELATHVKMLKKEDGLLNFNQNSETLRNFVRGMNPWPSAYTFLNGKMFKVFKASIYSGDFNAPCGAVLFADNKNGLVVKTRDGALRLELIQAEGGKKMVDTEYLTGHKIPVGTVLENA